MEAGLQAGMNREEEWTMEPRDPDRDYDVIVIGSGLGGLSCGAVLARAGMKVLVLEQSDRIGGCCSTFADQGFHFDVGAIFVQFLPLIDAVFARLGRKREDYIQMHPCDPIYSFRTQNGKRLDIPRDIEAAAGVFRKICPRDGEKWLEFCAFWREGTELLGRLLHRRIQPRKGGDLRSLLTPAWLKMLSVAWLDYETLLEKWFCHPTMREILGFQTSYIAFPPRLSPGFSAGLLYAGHGVHYPRGGMISIPRGIYRAGKEEGMELALKTEVTRIVVSNRRVRGVELKDGTRLFTRQVVSNLNIQRLYLGLIGEENLPRRVVKGVKSYAPSLPMPYVHLGVRGETPFRSHYSMQLLPPREIDRLWEEYFLRGRIPEAPPCLVCWHSGTDPELAPPGHQALNLAGLGSYQLEEGSWDERREEYIERLVEEVEKNIWPGLSGQIVYRNITTPRDFERRLLSPGGAVYPIQHDLPSMMPFRPANRSKSIKGLYLAGASTNPGAGVPFVTVGGCITADLVIKDFHR